MKKRTKIMLLCIAAILVVIIAVILILGYGNVWGKEKPEHYEVPNFYWKTEVSTSDGSMNITEIAALLSQLTNEDGTGEINLNMTWQEIAAVLDNKGILYKVNGTWTEADAEYSSDSRSIFTADGSYYRPYYGSIYLHQTKKGLRVGEPLSRTVELYGEPDKIEANLCYDNVMMYYYDMGKFYCETTDSERTVVLEITCGDDIVVDIEIRFLMDFDEGVFFE